MNRATKVGIDVRNASNLGWSSVARDKRSPSGEKSNAEVFPHGDRRLPGRTLNNICKTLEEKTASKSKVCIVREGSVIWTDVMEYRI